VTDPSHWLYWRPRLTNPGSECRLYPYCVAPVVWTGQAGVKDKAAAHIIQVSFDVAKASHRAAAFQSGHLQMRKLHFSAYLFAPRQGLATESLLLGGLSRTWYFLHNRSPGYDQSTVAIISSTHDQPEVRYWQARIAAGLKTCLVASVERNCPGAEINKAPCWTPKLSLMPVLHAAV